MEGSKVLNVTIGNPVEEDPILNQFSDKPITKEEEKEAKSFLKNVQDYIKSEKFVKDCNQKALETGYPPKKIAKTYIGKIAGTIGDGLGIAVDTANIGAVGLIDLISLALTKTVNLICNIVRGLIGIITFNRTNHSTATA